MHSLLVPKPGVLPGDARNLREHFGSLRSKPRAIVTSPPYLDLQDYRVAGQIGFGQSQREYLDDMRSVFKACGEVTTEDATMWLVVGPVRRGGELIQLPAMLADCARPAGWIQREQITWEKGKSLPWTKHGEMRDVTEQALLLSKTSRFLFEVDDLLSPEPRTTWWRRYPERYSPAGRLPTNLWSIPIPTQGSWRDAPNHVCPFPHELTYRMLTLVTAPGDVVLDPFAGVGSVAAMANAMGRIGCGLELNESYVMRYGATLEAARAWFQGRAAETERESGRRREFRRMIIELRLLKYARLIGAHLARQGISVAWLRVRKRRRAPSRSFKIVVAEFEIAVTDEEEHGAVIENALAVSRKVPLSKFGVQPCFLVSSAYCAQQRGYWYQDGKFWLKPSSKQPNGAGPHVVANFWPDPEGFDKAPK